MASDFSDYCCSSLENKNTLVIGRRKHFTEAVAERCFSNLYLAAIVKIILKEGVKHYKKNEMNAFLVTFQGSSSKL